jgi:ubiquinone/menaquinone biosynthesis C-methylase UbiE
MAAPATRMIFTEASIRPGMGVLNLGSGAGDTAFVAADLVGPGGPVIGADHLPDALARARYRAGRAARPRCSSTRSRHGWAASAY